MNKRTLLCVAVALCCAACRQSANKTDTTPRPVKVVTAEALGYVDRDFAGMATADDAVNMAFKLSGQVLSVDVSKGDYVRRGELLASLDPRDVELQVASDRSQFERARSQAERMKRLLDHEAVSQQEYEASQTAFVQARSAYENSADLLSQTKLRAPFAGVIERTYVDAWERVQSGQTILRLVNPISTTVEFTMPERSMALLSDSLTRFYVVFDNYPDRRFAARLHTYAKTASDASGFPVSLKIDKAESAPYHISPGMTCQVTLQAEDSSSSELVLPLTAIYAPAEGGEYVWVVGDDDRVERRAVELGDVVGHDKVVVLAGIRKGERVVSAGVYRLQEGERVRILNR
ncbi:MAG: efflux RND transporter periplasmic adaptor subunit [Rikenellaceae bacterium]|nr:efflux RND transporter periplasmic adaptor subunit [Rikenellaceae bacterium]